MISSTVNRLSVLGGILLSIAIAGTAWPQSPDSSTVAAQGVGTAFLKAIRAGDWKSAATFMDVIPLDHYRLQLVDQARRAHTQPMTVEQLMKSDSLMPRAVAEYEVRRMKQSARNFSFLEYEFGVTDADSLAEMSASAVAARWLEVHDPRWRLRREMARSHCELAVSDSLPTPGFRILGTVVNGATAYMLYERDDDHDPDFNEVRAAAPRMLTLRRGLDAWWVLPRESNRSESYSITCQPVGKAK